MTVTNHMHTVLGFSGIADNERELAQQWGRRFEIPMIFVGIWMLVGWYAELNGIISQDFVKVADMVVWLCFITETTVLTFLVEDKWRYLRSNWANVAIILMGIPIIWGVTTHTAALRSLRLLLLGAVFLHVSDTIRQVLSRNHLGITLLVSFYIIVASGIIIAGIDPGIETFWEGIWWAWVTVTTVGYGDVVPDSNAGKLFGAILILLGIGLFSLLTASFSAFFIAREGSESVYREQDALEKLDRIEQRLAGLEALLTGKSNSKKIPEKISSEIKS